MNSFQLGSDLSKEMIAEMGLEYEDNSKYSMKDTSKGVHILSSQTGKVAEIGTSLPDENIDVESMLQSMSESSDKWKDNAKRAKFIYNTAISICIISTLVSLIIISLN